MDLSNQYNLLKELSLHDSSQFFVCSLTVGSWNHVNTPYKTTHKTSMQFSVYIILASKLELDSSACSKMAKQGGVYVYPKVH